MICTEVGELMQRQLDHDLDERELTILMTHLGECKACQSLFERLTLLSGSLEQLPRVTPSISIVDSILPELEAIDRQRSEESVKPAKAAAGYWKRWMTATASVAAAAAVVFLMTNLDGISQKASDEAAVPNVAMVREISDKANNENNLGEVSMQDTSGSSNDDIFVEELYTGDDESGYTITPLSSPIESAQRTQQERSSSAEPAAKEPLDYTPTPTLEASQQQAINAAPLPNEIEQSEAPDVGASVVQQGPEAGKELMSGEEKNKITGNLVDQFGEAVAKDSETELEELNSSMGIASQDIFVEKHFSPDGQVYIVFEGHTIVLYETSTDVQQRTWEISVTGNPSFVEWDSSSSSFVYELQGEDGNSSRHTVNLKD